MRREVIVDAWNPTLPWNLGLGAFPTGPLHSPPPIYPAPMSVPLNPAFAAWLAAHPAPETTWIQVHIRRAGTGFALRHAADAAADPAELREVPSAGLRALATTTATGEFRPLRAAPNLAQGWRCTVDSAAGLARALELIYPGTVADWHAFRVNPAVATSLGAFTARQTGMYRITQTLDAARAAEVARASCAPRFCLKHRRWNVAGEADPAAAGKSAAPCLDPCAVTLELARHTARQAKQPLHPLNVSAGELATLRAALTAALDHAPAGRREADFADPLNRRRLQLLLEKFRALWDSPSPEEG